MVSLSYMLMNMILAVRLDTLSPTADVYTVCNWESSCQALDSTSAEKKCLLDHGPQYEAKAKLITPQLCPCALCGAAPCFNDESSQHATLVDSESPSPLKAVSSVKCRDKSTERQHLLGCRSDANFSCLLLRQPAQRHDVNLCVASLSCRLVWQTTPR